MTIAKSKVANFKTINYNQTIKKLLILLVILLPLLAHSRGHYSPFIKQQLSLVEKMNDDNITSEEIVAITAQQEALYSKALDNILKSKKDYINKSRAFSSEIFSLEKIINLNKRLGNNYATIRDEVLVKSYELLDAQNKMIKNILRALDMYDFEEFQTRLQELISTNKEFVKKLSDSDYTSILQNKDNSKILLEAQNNIKDFNNLVEINSDALKYLSLFEKKMYRLNKYSNMNLIKPVIAINNIEITKVIDSYISSYGLTVVKIIFILLLSLMVYIIRKFLYTKLDLLIYKIKFLKKYSKDILNIISKPLEILIIFINIEMAIYIYNDLVGVGIIAQFFNIVYVMLLTYIFYKIINVISSIKIYEIKTLDKRVKSEVVNIGIKIVNFVIIVIGLLIILHLSGANLTAVLSGLGIGGFAVAFAAKDSLANFFGTLSILLSDVFSQGDWIVVNGQEGTVVEIGLRVTTIRTFDNAIIAIPNSILANKDVKNWNKRSIGRRIKMSIGVKYDSKASDIKKAVDEIRLMLKNHPKISTENTKYNYSNYRQAKIVSKDDEIGIKRTLLVHLDEFAGSSINILIYCFSKSVVWGEWLEVKEDIMYNIIKILENNSLEFAFPSMSIYQENESNKLDLN